LDYRRLDDILRNAQKSGVVNMMFVWCSYVLSSLYASC